MAKKNRGKRGRQNAIRSFLAPLTPRQAKREARARTRLEFGEVGRALRSEMDASRQQSKNLNAWYQQYQDNMDRLRQGQLANTNALQEQSRQSAGLMSDAAAAQRTALDTEEAASAALRGATTSGAGATEAAGATQRQNLMAATRDANAQLGSSAYNRLAEVNAAADLGRQADQRQERNTQLKIRSKMRDLKRDKGAARLKNYSDVIRQERDYSIQNRTLAKDYGYQDAMRYVADQGVRKMGIYASTNPGGGGGGGGGGGASGKQTKRGISLLDGKYNPTDHYDGFEWLKKNPGRAVNYLVRAGVPRPSAKAAVRRYIKRWKTKINETPNSSGAGNR